jgi:hypothetical protein
LRPTSHPVAMSQGQVRVHASRQRFACVGSEYSSRDQERCQERVSQPGEWPPWVCLESPGTVLVIRPGAVLKVARRGICSRVPAVRLHCSRPGPAEFHFAIVARLPVETPGSSLQASQPEPPAASFLSCSHSVEVRSCLPQAQIDNSGRVEAAATFLFVVGSAAGGVTSRIFERSQIQV